MFEIEYGSKFRKAYKKLLRSGSFNNDGFVLVASYLLAGKGIPAEYHDHALVGDLQGYRECHISGDCLLIYEVYVDIRVIKLLNIGSHAKLFGN